MPAFVDGGTLVFSSEGKLYTVPVDGAGSAREVPVSTGFAYRPENAPARHYEPWCLSRLSWPRTSASR